MIQMTQKATYVCWERYDAQGRESMILCNSKRQTDGATRIYHTDRSSDPQTDRQADRQADRQTDRLTHRQTDRLTHRQTDKPSPDRQTDRHKDLQTWKQNRSVQIISDVMQRSL